VLSLLEVSRQDVYSAKGKHLGRVADVLFAPGATSVVGFVVSRPRMLFLIDRSDRYLALDRARFTGDGVVVADAKGAWDGSAAKRLGHSWDDTVIWVGMPVSTESGVKLGSVRDGLFDEKTGGISAIGLTSGLTADAAVGVRDVPASVVVGFDGQVVRVKDEAIAYEPSGGAAAAAGRSTAVAKKAAIDAAARAAVYGKAAAKAGGQSDMGKRAAGWLKVIKDEVVDAMGDPDDE
jgi:uncharacterized protein YrrD